MENVRCPMCGATHQRLLETIKSSDIVALYLKTFGKDFSYLLKGESIKYYECLNCSLRHFYPMVLGDESLYELLQQIPNYYSDTKEEYSIAQQFLLGLTTANISVLEVGAGKGAFRAYLKPNDRYVGLEFSQEAIRLAAENSVVLHPEMVEEYALKHPNSYDVVCSFQVLEHVANPRSFVESCVLALKPNGILIVAVPSEDGFIKNAINNALNMPPHHCTRYSDKMLKNVAILFNLELLSIEHELMSDENLYSATHTWLQSRMLRPRVIDVSLTRRVVGFFCGGFMKVFRFRNRKQHNHTVVAFYKKR